MRKFLRSLLLLPLLAAGIAYSAWQAFDQAGFDALQHQKKPILVAIHADWCPTCKAQEPILAELLKTPEFHSINALRVDFDKQKKIVKAFKVQYQSTLIVFKGGKEVGRSTGDTDKDDIAALLKKAL
ncbi:MAG: thioredoxin family protein [Betaproteobacteria bacterium]|nr:thioredoxin family protein [Betaproteobacteria bacterium]